MTMMKYILKNIASFAKNETVIFVIAMFCILASSFILNFSYGLFRNYKMAADEKEFELTHYMSSAPENTEFDMTVSEMCQYVEALSSDTTNRITTIYLYSANDALDIDEKLSKRFFTFFRLDTVYRDGEFIASSSNLELWKSNGSITSGRFFSDEEEKTGAYVTVIPYKDLQEQPTDDIKIGDKIKLFGQEYEVIGKHRLGVHSPKVPLSTIPKDIKLSEFGFIFDKPITRAAYDDLIDTAERVVPGKLAFPELQLPDDETLALYNNIILISAFIALLSAMNFAVLFLFILDKRKNSMAVMCLCGARKPQITLLYLCECLVLTVPVFAVGIIIFDILLKNLFKDLFPYMLEAFSPFIYFLIFAVYIAVMIITMTVIIAKNISANIKNRLTEGKI